VSDIDTSTAVTAMRTAAPNGSVNAAGTTRSGRPIYTTLTVEDAELQIIEAAQLEWVEADPDGYRLWVVTAAGRTIRLDAVHPDGPPRPIG
jgi:hypothetical protein